MKSPEATTWRQESARQDQNLRSPLEAGVLVTYRKIAERNLREWLDVLDQPSAETGFTEDLDGFI